LENSKNYSQAIGGVAIAIGIAIAGYFVSQTILFSRIGVNTASVKGLSERVVKADTYSLEISYSVSDSSEDFARDALYNRAKASQSTILQVINDHGLSESDYKVSPISYRVDVDKNRDYEVIGKTYTMSGFFKVASSDISSADKLYNALADLGATKLSMHVEPPQYKFTKLNEIKPEMLKEATQSARIAAEEFAKNAGAKVGSIQNAMQGGFSIRDLSDDRLESYDVNKRVRVVTSITFYLRD